MSEYTHNLPSTNSLNDSGSTQASQVLQADTSLPKLVRQAETDAAALGLPEGSTHVIQPTTLSANENRTPVVVNDPLIPKNAKDAPWLGVTNPDPDVPFNEQVKANAKYFAGKVTGDDAKVQEGAAKLRGVI